MWDWPDAGRVNSTLTRPSGAVANSHRFSRQERGGRQGAELLFCAMCVATLQVAQGAGQFVEGELGGDFSAGGRPQFWGKWDWRERAGCG